MYLRKTQQDLQELFLSTFRHPSTKTILCTAFHPYATCPLRLLSTTYLLYQYGLSSKKRIINLVWDIVYPNTVKAREELYIYLPGFIPPRRCWLFQENLPYLFQHVKELDLEKYIELYKGAVLVQKCFIEKRKALEERAKILVNEIYQPIFSFLSPAEFTVNMVANWIGFIGFPKLADWLVNISFSQEEYLNFIFKTNEILIKAIFSQPSLFDKLVKISSESNKPLFISLEDTFVGIFAEKSGLIVKNIKGQDKGNSICSISSPHEFVGSKWIWGSLIRGLVFGLLEVEEFAKRYPVYDLIEKYFCLRITTPTTDFIPCAEVKEINIPHYKLIEKENAYRIQKVSLKEAKTSRFLNTNLFYVLYGLEFLTKNFKRTHIRGKPPLRVSIKI